MIVAFVLAGDVADAHVGVGLGVGAMDDDLVDGEVVRRRAPLQDVCRRAGDGFAQALRAGGVGLDTACAFVGGHARAG